MNAMNENKTLLDILPRKKEFAITGKHIENELGFKSDYEVRKAVNALRSAGNPICSNSNGYWLSDKPEEVMETIHNLEHRKESIAKACGGLYHWYMEEGLWNGDSQDKMQQQ